MHYVNRPLTFRLRLPRGSRFGGRDRQTWAWSTFISARYLLGAYQGHIQDLDERGAERVKKKECVRGAHSFFLRPRPLIMFVCMCTAVSSSDVLIEGKSTHDHSLSSES